MSFLEVLYFIVCRSTVLINLSFLEVLYWKKRNWFDRSDVYTCMHLFSVVLVLVYLFLINRPFSWRKGLLSFPFDVLSVFVELLLPGIYLMLLVFIMSTFQIRHNQKCFRVRGKGVHPTPMFISNTWICRNANTILKAFQNARRKRVAN